jgi:hypothetical protein
MSTTFLPSIGSLWIHKTKGTIVLVRGYETISPAGYRGDDNNIIKLFRTAENRMITEITNQFTYYYEPLEQGQ